MFDEAFGNMDTARTASALKFMVDSQLQVLLATPPDSHTWTRCASWCVRIIMLLADELHPAEIDKGEMMRELEGE